MCIRNIHRTAAFMMPSKRGSKSKTSVLANNSENISAHQKAENQHQKMDAGARFGRVYVLFCSCIPFSFLKPVVFL
jgi:hypothetical protein